MREGEVVVSDVRGKLVENDVIEIEKEKEVRKEMLLKVKYLLGLEIW